MESIEYIVWDVDQTLYKGIKELNEDFDNRIYKAIQEKFNLSFDEAKNLFKKKLEETDSFTKTFYEFKLEEKAREILGDTKYELYLKKDKKLINMFNSLKNYKHAIISNGTKKSCYKVLSLLGLSLSIFDTIITIEDVKNQKPHEEPFLKLIEKTGLPPEKHVYIGDREKTDIAPAKKVGMKTILVWGKSEIADFSLPSVYEVIEVLKKNK